MNQENIYMIFRTKMGDSALRIYRERQFWTDINNESVRKEFLSLFTELYSQCDFSGPQENKTLSGEILADALHSHVSNETVIQIGKFLALNEQDVWRDLFIGFEHFLENFEVTIQTNEKSDVDYTKLYLIEYSIGVAYGLFCCEKQECHDQAFVRQIVNMSVHGFFDSFEIDENVYVQIISSINPLEILKRSRYFSRNDDANSYLAGCGNASVDEMAINIENYLASDGFLPIDGIYYVLSKQLLREENFALWLELIDKMECPILQNEMMFMLDDSLLCEKVACYILSNTQKCSKPKVILALLRNRWFQCLIDNTKNVMDSIKISGTTTNEHEMVDDCSKDWNQGLQDRVKSFIQSMLKDLSPSDFSKWCLKKKLYDSSRPTTQSEANNKIVNTLWDTLLQLVTWNQLDTSDGDYRFVLFCSSCYLEDGNSDKEQLYKYASEMEASLCRDDFFWNMSLNDSIMSELRKWNRLIALLDKDYPYQLLHKNLVVWEGYEATSFGDIYKLQRRENFIMTSLALLLENEQYYSSVEERKTYFKNLANTILSQQHCCSFDRLTIDYYYLPLYVLELVAEQVFHDIREWYHRELITKVEDFRTLLNLLTSANCALTDDNREMLNERKQKEWTLIKGGMEDLPQTKRGISIYEEKMVKLGI